MLLKSLKASNFMKYNLLEIRDLEDKKLIGIFGENESGKSTIAEAVSFSLFGMSARFGDSLSQIINWDNDECELSLSFVVEDNEYTILRRIDRKENHKAVLYAHDKTTPIASGVGNVDKEIWKLTRINFEDFRYTFYLMQKEIDLIIKQKSINIRSILQDMLGFNRLTLAKKKLQERNKELLLVKDKCENELLLTQTMMKNIPYNSEAKRELHNQLEAEKQSYKNIQKTLEEKKEEVKTCKELVSTRTQLFDTFNNMGNSFSYSLHKNGLQESLNELSDIYAVLRDEKNILSDMESEAKGHWKNFQKKAKETEKFVSQLDELQELVQSYHKHIQKRLVFPDKGKQTPTSDNLQMHLEKADHTLNKTVKLGIGLILTGIFCAFGILYSFISAIMLSLGKNIIFFPISMKNISYLPQILLLISFISILLLFFSFLGVIKLRKKFATLLKAKSDILSKIELFQKEIDICLNFSLNKLDILEDQLKLLSDPHSINKIESIKMKYTHFFEKYTRLEELLDEIETEKEKHITTLKKIENKYRDIENFGKLIESLAKDIDFKRKAKDEYKELLRNIKKIEKRIYQLLEIIQKHKTSIKECELRSPLEIDKSWEEYEKNREKFIELARMSAMGGGTGMLNRLQLAFKHNDADKLTQAFSNERENLFSTLASDEELILSLEEEIKTKESFEDASVACLNAIQSLELNYEKCQKGLESKKELREKSYTIKNRLEDIEHTIKVNEVAMEMVEGTLLSAYKRFTPGISKIMSKVLKRITNNRYTHVQVEEDFTLKAFSTQKNDFIKLAELSGGTVDQLYISLRLAFAQAVMAAKVGSTYKQFLFFDEPLMSFDRERSCSFLDLLSDYNKNFVQIFVISPKEQANLFDFSINTELAKNKLVLSGCVTKKREKIEVRSQTKSLSKQEKHTKFNNQVTASIETQKRKDDD